MVSAPLYIDPVVYKRLKPQFCWSHAESNRRAHPVICNANLAFATVAERKRRSSGRRIGVKGVVQQRFCCQQARRELNGTPNSTNPSKRKRLYKKNYRYRIPSISHRCLHVKQYHHRSTSLSFAVNSTRGLMGNSKQLVPIELIENKNIFVPLLCLSKGL